MLVFEKRRKPEYPEKNLSEQRRELTTNSTLIWRRRLRIFTRATLVGGERSHHCAIPCSPRTVSFSPWTRWRFNFHWASYRGVLIKWKQGPVELGLIKAPNTCIYALFPNVVHMVFYFANICKLINNEISKTGFLSHDWPVHWRKQNIQAKRFHSRGLQLWKYQNKRTFLHKKGLAPTRLVYLDPNIIT